MPVCIPYTATLAWVTLGVLILFLEPAHTLKGLVFVGGLMLLGAAVLLEGVGAVALTGPLRVKDVDVGWELVLVRVFSGRLAPGERVKGLGPSTFNSSAVGCMGYVLGCQGTRGGVCVLTGGPMVTAGRHNVAVDQERVDVASPGPRR